MMMPHMYQEGIESCITHIMRISGEGRHPSHPEREWQMALVSVVVGGRARVSSGWVCMV